MRRSRGTVLLAGFASLALTAVAPGLARSQGSGGKAKGPNFYSVDTEKELGKQVAREVERSSKLIDDPVVADYVNRIAQTIAKNSDAKFPITVRIIDSKEINAFTLPGGYQYVNRGLILAAQSEAELAGVLAHSIAHTAMRSETKQATKSELMQLTLIPAMIFTPYSWVDYSSMFQGLNLAIPVAFLKFSRDAQRAADFYAVQYLYKAGYNAESYPQFLERVGLQTLKGQNIPKTFSAFPPLPERVKATREEIARFAQRDSEIVSTSDFEAIKERLEHLAAQRFFNPGLKSREANTSQTGGPDKAQSRL